MSSSSSPSDARTSRSLLVLVAVAVVSGLVIYAWWNPERPRDWLRRATSWNAVSSERDKPTHKSDHPDHEVAPRAADSQSLRLTAQARKNLKLRVASAELRDFSRSISVPGMVVERPGLSTILVTAPLTGVITRIHVLDGEAIEPGRKLFDLRLTHEELVQSQAELLQTAEELDVTAREIRRIEQLAEQGGLAGKQLLERQYERQKLEAVLHSRREALLLHGLSTQQIDSIIKTRRLLPELSVFAPPAVAAAEEAAANTPWQVQALKVSPGQHVSAGDTLLTLTNYEELYIQGEAFERDLDSIQRAADANAELTAIWDTESGRPETVTNLKLLYLAPRVDPDSRTLDFFVALPNELRRDARLPAGARFIAWRFRPGERVQLSIPVETWENRLVLPIDAVALDGPEAYVFLPKGDRLERRAVHLEYRDSRWAVIANDGALVVGAPVIVSSAQQLHFALKNQLGGGIDPHAGHQH